MYMIHEAEILLKEKYGADANEITYVKPAVQGTVVVLDDKKVGNISNWFTKVFLPHGYPNSVSGDYVAYQIWDTAQAFCSTITGILATQEVLRGVGVGDVNATPLAATIIWVIKDGCGHMGKILFAFTHGNYLDAYSKKWRLYADTLNDAAMCIEIALPLFKNYTTFVLCISTVMKAIVGVAGGATRAAMTQHHAIRGNMADVSAKDAAQETAVNLLASFTALLLITLFGNSLIVFLLMMILHIVFNYLAVRAVCLRTFNEPRFLQLIDFYLKKELIATPCSINRTEPIIFYYLGPYLLDLKLCGFQIKLGHSIKNLIRQNPSAVYLKRAKEVYRCRNYILMPNIYNRTMYIVFKEEALTDDILCAYFHAVLLSIVICAINEEYLEVYDDNNAGPFVQLCHTLQVVMWSKEIAEGPEPISGFIYNPSSDLLKYMDNIVHKEWNKLRDAIRATGWDMSKHLLLVDEWRVTITKREKKSVQTTVQTDPKLKRVKANKDDEILPYDDDNAKIKTKEIRKVQEVTIEPEIVIKKKSSAVSSKLDLEIDNEPPKSEPRVQMSAEVSDAIEPFVSQAEMNRQKKKE